MVFSVVGATNALAPAIALAEARLIRISLGDRPQGIVLDLPIVSIDGIQRGIAPLLIREEIDTAQPMVVGLLTAPLSFSAKLVASAGAYNIEPLPNGHCKPFDAHWRVSGTDTELDIHVDIVRVGTWDCQQDASIGAPEGRGKLKFSSLPTGALVYYPKYSGGFVVQPTPLILVVDFLTVGESAVFFKKNGFLDCARHVRFERKGQAYWVLVDGHRIGVATNDDDKAPEIACQMDAAKATP